jgi:hypothetical protein
MGLGAFASWTGGTLRDFLVAFESAASATAAAVALKAAKAGDTITGPFVFSGSNARIQYRAPMSLPNTATHTMTLNTEFFSAANVSQNSLYTIPNPTAAGQWFVARRQVVGSGSNASFARADATTIGILPDTGKAALLFVSQSNGGGGWEWSAWPLGGTPTIIGS